MLFYKLTSLFLCFTTLLVTSCVSYNQVENKSASHPHITDAQIDQFATRAYNFSPLKDLIGHINSKKLDNLKSMENVSITESQKACLLDGFTDEYYHEFFRQRVKTYFSLYPHRYEHDWQLLNSGGSELFLEFINDMQQGIISDPFEKDIFEPNAYDVYMLAKDPINQPLRDLLILPNPDNIVDYDMVGAYIMNLTRDCHITYADLTESN